MGRSRRCLALPPLQSLGPSLMALLVYLAQQLQRQPHQRTKRNSVFSKPCSPCSSPRPTPRPRPQHPPPPSVVVCSEAGSLVVPAMTRQPQQPQQQHRPQPPPQPPPNVEVFLEGDFFA